MKINLLTADVYNRIAAGEVVDRPYSVVKELVENAIDAGATEITIEADQGGKKRVRVSDNGCGIEKEDLKSAFLPHATSKLKTADDLERIVTLGFRGEAVASIAAVSETAIVSKTADGEGYSIVCNGGKIGEPVREGCADGTCVTVDNLFFNTPARLKFLKSDAQEEGDVSNMVSRFILSRPEIAFTYVVNGKIKYRSFGDGLRSALAVVYGAGILGDCYEIDAEKHGIRLRGFIGNQNFSKPNRSWQSLFVNGRYVVNQTVSAAISNAYGSYLMKRQYPFYTLFLDVPPEIVDVNVHPNKADVRFADNQIIYGSVYSVISAVLDGNSRALEYLAEKPAPATGADGAATREQPSVADRSLNFSERTVPQMTIEEAKKELRFELSTKETKQELRFELPSTDLSAAEEERSPLNVLEVRAPKAEEDYFAENKRFLEEREKMRKQEKIDPARLTYKGELFQTYLIYEEGDTAYLVDQHAAHERTIYDRLREKYLNRSVLSQPMLAPYLLNVNAQEFAFLSERLDALRDLGFEIEEFGGNSFKVSALPVDLRNMSLDEFFNEVLRQTESLRSIRLVDILKDKLATAACKAAVKGGEKLTEEEVIGLLKKMDGDMGLKCPHGRPVAVKLTKTEVEKLFKRIV
ncbi:MAG: DNA mismatch repair endonuclease MutL [Candidatus Gallimonas sp.]